MSLLPGVNELKAELHAQNEATKEHRVWEGEVLREIKADASEAKVIVKEMNGRVNDHEVELARLKERNATIARVIASASALAGVGVLIFYLLS